MNKEFAVEPTAFENALQLKYIVEKFGFYHDRFIVGFPSKWIKQVHDHVQRFPEIEQARARRLLEGYANNSIVPSGGLGYEPALSWVDNVYRASSVDHNLFDGGVIAANANSFGFHTVHDVDDLFFGVSHDSRIVGSVENYAKVIRRLLQMSHEVVIVDPYLRLEKPQRAKVIQKFIEIALKGKCRSFVIWARYDDASMKTKEFYHHILVELYRKDLPAPKAKLTIKLVEDGRSKEKMHARLLLSTLGGLRFDYGFEEFNDSRKVDISLLSQKAHDDHFRWYLDPNSQNDFDIIEEHTISG
ncbi:MAG: hypothetical protein ACXWTS_01730 [Methylococcaceae bacterium]